MSTSCAEFSFDSLGPTNDHPEFLLPQGAPAPIRHEDNAVIAPWILQDEDERPVSPSVYCQNMRRNLLMPLSLHLLRSRRNLACISRHFLHSHLLGLALPIYLALAQASPVWRNHIRRRCWVNLLSPFTHSARGNLDRISISFRKCSKSGVRVD